MMICPKTFYEMNLKGKTPEQIMTVIRSLKREIGRLKNIVEHPDYKATLCPSEETQLLCAQSYLDTAKRALIEAGSNYVPSVSEKKEIEFNENVPYINKIIFSIGGYFGGYETKTFTVEGDKIRTYIEHSLMLKPSNFDDGEIENIDKEDFFEEIKNLHIGNWRRKYDTQRFGITVLDGTAWHLEFYYSNGHRPVKIHGSSAYPYNFNHLLELFEIEE